MYVTPSASPTSYTAAMFGCVIAAAARASRTKRRFRSASPTYSGGTTSSATADGSTGDDGGAVGQDGSGGDDGPGLIFDSGPRADQSCSASMTCAQAHANCGQIGDGCGNVLQCGTCGTGQTCGGGGVAN